MNQLIVSLSRLNNNGLYARAGQILANLSGQPGDTYFPEPYPAPFPTLASILADAEALKAAMDKITSTAVTAERNSLRLPLIVKLQKLAPYLEVVAWDHPEWLAYTGYGLRKTPEHTHLPPAAPANVRVRATGQDGGILVKCAPDPLADFYELETSVGTSAGPWLTRGSFPGSQDIHAEGFAHGDDVFVHVRAVGTNGPGPWSDTAVVLVS